MISGDKLHRFLRVDVGGGFSGSDPDLSRSSLRGENE